MEERPLSERFGVSKTPIREALIQLSSIGLVELRQRRGAIVTVLSVDQVISIMQTETIPHERALSSIEMFGKHVIPACRAESRAKPVAAGV